MERTREITVNGTPIVHLDFTGLTDDKEALAAFEEARRFIARYPKESARTLTDVSRSRAGDQMVAGLKSLAKANRPYVKAGAVVGLTAVQQILFKAVMAFSGRNLSAFATLEEAKRWLSRQ